MVRWKRPERVPLEAMPAHLQDSTRDDPDSVKRERVEWLEANGWTFLDWISWRRRERDKATGVVRPPARRKGPLPAKVRKLLQELESEEQGKEEAHGR
jgi:hypothetical protein